MGKSLLPCLCLQSGFFDFFPSYLSSLGIETTQNGTNLTSNCLISVKPELDRPKDKFSVFDVISLSYSSWEHRSSIPFMVTGLIGVSAVVI